MTEILLNDSNTLDEWNDWAMTEKKYDRRTTVVFEIRPKSMIIIITAVIN